MRTLLRAASAVAIFAGIHTGAAHGDALDADIQATAVDGVVVPGAANGEPVGLPVNANSVSADQIGETINAVTTEDALKYMGTIFIRRRHIGDTQAPMTTRTSGVGSSARSLIYADGVLLSALIGNNNSTASPRWGMVAPEDIARVDLRFGPFSAAFPGNSIGAVVEISTRNPRGFEASGRVDAGWQSFSAYGTKDDYRTLAGALSVGDRRGPFSWRLGYTHVDSQAQPLTYVTAARAASPSSTGVAAMGAFSTVNRFGAPIVVIGAGAIEDQRLETARLRLTLDLPGDITGTFAVGYFGNRANARAETYLRDAAGAPVYSGALNIGGYAYSISASTFSNGVYTYDEGHFFQSLGLSSAADDELTWRLIGSVYDYDRDLQRIPGTALPTAGAGGSGSIVDLSGTGWRTFDASLAWSGLTNQVWRAGGHSDQYRLFSHRYATTDWRTGSAGALMVASEGRTETSAFWLEDKVSLGPDLDLTIGLRAERWRAFDGLNYSSSPALNVTQPARSAARASPKAVLVWRASPEWTVSVSAAEAFRFPTVSELYQAVTTGSTLSVPNPDLDPEHALSGELALRRDWAGGGYVRLAYFTESIKDALISQTAPVSPGASTLAAFVQNIGQTRADGVDLSFNFPNALPSLDLSGAVTFVDARIADNPVLPASVGKQTPQVPRWRATLVATWRPTEAFSVTAAARYSDRVYATIDNTDIVTHTYQGFDAYLVIDLRAVWKLGDRWSISAGIDNVAGRDYILFHPFPQRSMLVELKYAY